MFPEANFAGNAERNSSKEDHKMFCSKCGKAIPDDSVFCPECGASLGKQQASVTSPPSEEVSTVMNIGIIAASIFIPFVGALVGLIIGIIYMKDKDL